MRGREREVDNEVVVNRECDKKLHMEEIIVRQD